jgi:hypothetical protein
VQTEMVMFHYLHSGLNEKVNDNLRLLAIASISIGGNTIHVAAFFIVH